MKKATAGYKAGFNTGRNKAKAEEDDDNKCDVV